MPETRKWRFWEPAEANYNSELFITGGGQVSNMPATFPKGACVQLSDGQVYTKDQLAVLVPSYGWDTFFDELIRLKDMPPSGEAKAADRSVPQPPPPEPEPPQNQPQKQSGPEDPLPEGWTVEAYDGKPLYGNTSNPDPPILNHKL